MEQTVTLQHHSIWLQHAARNHSDLIHGPAKPPKDLPYRVTLHYLCEKSKPYEKTRIRYGRRPRNRPGNRRGLCPPGRRGHLLRHRLPTRHADRRRDRRPLLRGGRHRLPKPRSVHGAVLRRTGRYRHPGQQRRDQPLQTPHRALDRGVRPRTCHQPAPGLHHLAPAGPPPPAERQSQLWTHCQPLLDTLPAERGRHRGLLCLEGRHLLTDPRAGRLAGAAAHHGQRHRPGMDPRPRGGAAAPRRSPVPPLGPRRHPGGHCPHVPLPVRRGERLHQRPDADRRRRRDHPHDLSGGVNTNGRNQTHSAACQSIRPTRKTGKAMRRLLIRTAFISAPYDDFFCLDERISLRA